jgi:hypothetical protein
VNSVKTDFLEQSNILDVYAVCDNVSLLSWAWRMRKGGR